MQALLNFIDRLNPRIQKPTVQKDMEATIKELNGFAIPMVKSMGDQAKVVPFKSEFHKVFESQVRNYVKFERKNDNIWINLHEAMANVSTNANELKRLIDDVLQEDTLRDGINARAAHMLRMAGAFSFVSSFTLELTDYVLKQEAVKLGDADDTPPAQAKHMAASLERYAAVLSECAMPPKVFAKMFADLPEVFVSSKNASSVAAMFTPKQVDPFSTIGRVSNWASSPVFMLRMLWETYQAERYHAAKDRKAMLELRLLHLQNKLDNNPSPRLQKEIEGLESRINKYDKKIREIEASVHGN